MYALFPDNCLFQLTKQEPIFIMSVKRASTFSHHISQPYLFRDKRESKTSRSPIYLLIYFHVKL